MMDIVSLIKKGFSMLEMLVCMIILSSFLLLTINNTNYLNVDHYSFLNNYLYSQSCSIVDCKQINLDKGIYFNSMGHVNQARTINIANHNIIIHLGNGYVTYE